MKNILTHIFDVITEFNRTATKSTAAKTSCENKPLYKLVYFVIIPSCSHSIWWTTYPTNGVVEVPLM